MLSEIRRSLRQLLKSPGFLVISLVTLALGIGVNTAAFTALNRLLLQSLPFKDPDTLVRIYGTVPQYAYGGQSPGDYFDLKEQSSSFTQVAAFYRSPLWSLVETGKPPERVSVMPVTANFLPMLGVRPEMGTLFTPAQEAHHDTVVVLSDAFWKKRFGADASILGRTLRVNDKDATVVGVLPPVYDDPVPWQGEVDMWSLDPTDVNRGLRSKNWYNVGARLKPGVTVRQAQAEVTAIASRLAHDFPQTNAQRGFHVEAFPTDSMGTTGRQLTWLVMDLALVVLVIACFNLANLQLVRTTARARDYAIRLALGSSRARLMRLVLMESLLVSFSGGALAILIAKWCNDYLAAFFNMAMPLDLRVLAFAFVAAVLTGAVFGIVPAWIASRTDVNHSLKQSGRGSTSDRSRHGLRHSLIVAELALALTLLTGAGYFVRGIHRVVHRDLGWNPSGLLVGFIALPHDRYGEEGDPRSLVFDNLFQAALLKIPGVDQAVVSRGTPLYASDGGPFLVEGRPPEKGEASYLQRDWVNPGYFKIYSIPLLQGRDFTDADRGGSANVIIINDTMAKKLWPDESAIGKRIGDADPKNPNWCEVVGVVGDFVNGGNWNPGEMRYEAYRPLAARSHRFSYLTVHSLTDPHVQEEPVRRALARLEPGVAPSFLQTPDEYMAGMLSGMTFIERMLVQIAILGLLLAAVGTYGVIANLVSERTAEVGIRMALGAQRGDVLWLFLRNGIRLAFIGTLIGVGCSFALMRILGKMMAFLPGNDPWIIGAVAVILVAVALLACWIPARRATGVDPNIALRTE